MDGGEEGWEEEGMEGEGGFTSGTALARRRSMAARVASG